MQIVMTLFIWKQNFISWLNLKHKNSDIDSEQKNLPVKICVQTFAVTRLVSIQ